VNRVNLWSGEAVNEVRQATSRDTADYLRLSSRAWGCLLRLTVHHSIALGTFFSLSLNTVQSPVFCLAAKQTDNPYRPMLYGEWWLVNLWGGEAGECGEAVH
jgi:hypothetical protein